MQYQRSNFGIKPTDSYVLELSLTQLLEGVSNPTMKPAYC